MSVRTDPSPTRSVEMSWTTKNEIEKDDHNQFTFHLCYLVNTQCEEEEEEEKKTVSSSSVTFLVKTVTLIKRNSTVQHIYI